MMHPQLKEYRIIDEADLKIGDIVTLMPESPYSVSRDRENWEYFPNPVYGIGKVIDRRQWNNSYGIRDIIKVQLISSIQAPQINYKQKQIQIL